MMLLVCRIVGVLCNAAIIRLTFRLVASPVQPKNDAISLSDCGCVMQCCRHQTPFRICGALDPGSFASLLGSLLIVLLVGARTILLCQSRKKEMLTTKK